MPADFNRYRAPWWLPGGNLQTVWSALYARRGDGSAPVYRRTRWDTADGDVIDVDWAADSAGAGDERPLLALFHGLEGSSASAYAQSFAAAARARGWAFAVPHFRGCAGTLNLAPRAYHSGDYEEIGWMLQRLREAHGAGPILSVGVSLGGNALLRWAEEAGADAARLVSAVAAVCSPIDLGASARAIGRGFNRHVYTRMFLASMKPKALAKLVQHPGLFDAEVLKAARDLYDFDDVFTAPLHGFRDAEDYWRRCSAAPRLGDIRLPALVLNAANDPFVPVQSLPTRVSGDHVVLWRPRHGGHVGFPRGALPPGDVNAMPEAVCHWLGAHLPLGHTSRHPS
ncbi:YheT family hydrolase [Xylophilus sp. GOD-11R]|uniref:YheT family hydrolase n=1 Tax=Xylophilus sp. GOD-11R TaxID=3089814 RepID=UPI00298D018E|nr:alpha/beta fold hydrolase [Xylophilus sp. GOD-11R]WPB56747.1 alpha/beta fold hydrolase [Xylophilus sp. GOD-11R]